MRRIDRYIDIGGERIPVDRDGNLLDWKRSVDGFAAKATSPHGHRRFLLGGSPKKIVLDYCVLPDGRYWMTAEEEPAGLGLHPEDTANVHSPADADEAAYRLVDRCLDVLERCGVTHREKVYGDPWSYARSIWNETKSPGGSGPR